MTETDRRTIAGRHAARYGRAVQACARHAMSDDYTDRRARELDRIAQHSAHAALAHGHRSPILDRLERAYPELAEMVDA